MRKSKGNIGLVLFALFLIGALPSEVRSDETTCLNGAALAQVEAFVAGNLFFVNSPSEQKKITFTRPLRERLRHGVVRSICSNYLPMSAYSSIYMVSSECIETGHLPGNHGRLFSTKICSIGLAVSAFSSNFWIKDQRDVVMTYPTYLGYFEKKDSGRHDRDVPAVTVHHMMSSLMNYFAKLRFDSKARDFSSFLSIAFKERRKAYRHFVGGTEQKERLRMKYDLEPRYPGFYGLWSPFWYIPEKDHPTFFAVPGLVVIEDHMGPFGNKIAYLEQVLPIFLLFPETAKEVLTEEEYDWLEINLPLLAQHKSKEQ